MPATLNSIGLTTDSGSYDILERAVEQAPPAGIFIEIGTRRGGSTKFIIDAMMRSGKEESTLVCVDPYGNIEYAEREGVVRRLDYDNKMRNDTLKNLFSYTHDLTIDVHLLILEDTEYFTRYGDGFPVYNEHKRLLTEYSCIFYDGPHDVASLKVEIDFFQSRTLPGALAVFDDVSGYYPHDEEIEPYLFELGWELIEKRAPKASYIKKF